MLLNKSKPSHGRSRLRTAFGPPWLGLAPRILFLSASSRRVVQLESQFTSTQYTCLLSAFDINSPEQCTVYEMSDSDSELSSAPTIPSDATLEKGLRDAVAKVFKTNNRDDLTVKRMRTAAEKALDLPEGFFKGDDRWKADSERIIKDEAVSNEKIAPTRFSSRISN